MIGLGDLARLGFLVLGGDGGAGFSCSSLLNFTVPLSNVGESAAGQGMIFPKLKYRFRLIFIGFGASTDTTELTKQVIDFKRPSVKFDDQVIDVYNSKIHYAGKPAWESTTITLRDDMEGAIQSLVGQQLQRQFDFLNQASASSAYDYKFEVLAQQLDGGNGISEPVVLETWDLSGCYISGFTITILKALRIISHSSRRIPGMLMPGRIALIR